MPPRAGCDRPARAGALRPVSAAARHSSKKLETDPELSWNRTLELQQLGLNEDVGRGGLRPPPARCARPAAAGARGALPWRALGLALPGVLAASRVELLPPLGFQEFTLISGVVTRTCLPTPA